MAKARKRSARAIEKEQDELYARLRSHGEDEARRRWREAEQSGAWFDRRRHLVLAEFERMAAEARPERMRWIRENLGEREAEFRQGIAQEIKYLIRNGPPVRYDLSAEQLEEITSPARMRELEVYKKTLVGRSR